ncbi:unnamed protein product [Polarella glacialis]|uniref:Uncharacterized protein n=1 Tax=Polarella glacialis TaxID=89957 RepID=A0A813JZI4_POLGL|nr:unnamed protein product [Polarella glacialis]
MNIVSHFPQHKHLHEESFARKAIEDKIVNSLENFEDIIRHLDVNLQMVENFHREKTSHHKPSEKGTDDSEEPILLDPLPDRESGHKVLAPYIFKVSVSLTNDHVVHLTNSEKHAQSSFTEALDHMVDVVRKSLREEKEKVLTSRKKEKRNMMPDTDEDGEDEEAIAARMTEDLDLEKDEATAKMYAKVEGSE